MSSYFCALRLRQPLPGEIGGGMSGGIGIPAAPLVPSGVAADASCTGVASNGAALGGAERLPIGTAAPSAAEVLISPRPAAPSALRPPPLWPSAPNAPAAPPPKFAAAPPNAFSPSETP